MINFNWKVTIVQEERNRQNLKHASPEASTRLLRSVSDLSLITTDHGGLGFFPLVASYRSLLCIAEEFLFTEWSLFSNYIPRRLSSSLRSLHLRSRYPFPSCRIASLFSCYFLCPSVRFLLSHARSILIYCLFLITLASFS